MAKKVILTTLLCLAGFLLYVALKPADMLIAREITIKASPEIIFPYINNSKVANDWMPWKDSDPEVKMLFTGPAEGVGSKSSWNSTGQMGTGEALVIESEENRMVKTQLTYTQPFEMKQLAVISLTPINGDTTVRWSVSGHSNFFFRLMGVFVDCDSMIGGEFEKGLRRLKDMVEGR